MYREANKDKNYSARYQQLLKKYLRLRKAYQNNQLTFNKLLKKYFMLKRQFLYFKKSSNIKVKNFIRQFQKNNYKMIITPNKQIIRISEKFLHEIDMSKDEFAHSFYLDILFEKFLPYINSKKKQQKIEPFLFPIQLKNYQFDEIHIHPYLYYKISGKLAYMARFKQYFYFLSAENISSQVELDYLQKTDSLVQSLTISNLNLMKAQKSIEVHKTMLTLLTCSLIQEYNQETSEHIQRIRTITQYLSSECYNLGLFNHLDCDINEYIKNLNYTSVFHDIGKMAIPNHLLIKKDKLTPDEMKILQKHCLKGAEYIKRMIDFFKKDQKYVNYIQFLQIPYEICLHHHERWDGKGYPVGLKGKNIPICARIVAVADTYDAIRGNRIYDQSRPHTEAIKIISRESNRQFDPHVVRAFINIQNLLQKIEY